MSLTLEQLNQLWGEPINASSIDLQHPLGSVCIDSRILKKGDFFVPLVGENFNGHSFLVQVLEKGAQAAVVSKGSGFDVPLRLMHWEVEDTLNAYQQLGLLNRLALKIPVVAVTGSVGKTTTREIIKSALSSLGKILSTTENRNNDIGVPATLLQGNSSHFAAVIEMGMRGLGEIERLSKCTQPDIAVITNIGSAHIGRLGSRAKIAKAKCEITAGLASNGVVIIPAYDKLLERTIEKAWSGRILRVAIEDYNLLNSSQDNFFDYRKPDLVATFDLNKVSLSVDDHIFKVPLAGKHNAMNFLLAIAVARELGVPLDKLTNLSVNSSPGRNRRITLGGINIFDETYNASPESVQAALEELVSQHGRHFAVLGKMNELGEHSIYYHEKIAQLIVKFGLDGLIIVADEKEALSMINIIKGNLKVEFVSRAKDAINPLINWLRPGDNLLLKGSRIVELEKILPLIKEEFKL